MDISSTKRSGAPLTDNEKLMVINVYNYFSGDNSKKEDHRKITLRKHVAEVLGIGEATVGRVVSDWKSRGDNTFTPHKFQLRIQKSKKLLIGYMHMILLFLMN